MIAEVNLKWVKELGEIAAAEELPPKVAELAKVAGVGAAVKTFVFYAPLQTTFPKKCIDDMRKLYIRKKFGEYSAIELAKILGVSLPFVYEVINSPANSPGDNQMSIYDCI